MDSCKLLGNFLSLYLIFELYYKQLTDSLVCYFLACAAILIWPPQLELLSLPQVGVSHCTAREIMKQYS